jgi:predicted Zn-dependent peptidase
MYQKTILENGLKIISEKIDSVRSVTIGIWILAGSRHEEKSEAGLAHYIEHVTFKGTPTRTPKQIAAEIESVGGSLNAMTDKEIACFYAKVLDTHLSTAVNLLSDIVLNSTYPTAELEREKGVILEEIRMYEDDPDEVAIDTFTSGLWPEHAIGRPTIGYAETVSSFTREDVFRYREKHYPISNILVTAAGNLEHDQLVKLISEVFPSGKSNNGTVSSNGKPPAPQFSKQNVEKPIEQIHFCMGTQSFPRNHPDRFGVSVLSVILGGGMSSRLFQEVREKLGLVYGIGAFGQSFRDTGMFGIMAGTSPEKYNKVVEVIHRELELIRKEQVSEQELLDGKEQLKGNIVLGLESSNSRMIRLAEQEIYFGQHFSIDELLVKIDAVTRDDIQRLAVDLFDESKLSLAVVGPISKIK